MNAEIVMYDKNIDESMLDTSKLFYPDIKISNTKIDIERLIRKSMRDRNYSFLQIYRVLFKLNIPIFLYNELKILGIKSFVMKMPVTDASFSLPAKIKDKDKLQTIFINHFKKIFAHLNDGKDNFEINQQTIDFLPLPTNITIFTNGNLTDWFKFCFLKETLNTNEDLRFLSNLVYVKLNEIYPHIFNSKNLKVYIVNFERGVLLDASDCNVR